MKGLRYITVVLFALVASEVFAWSATFNKTILMLAEENLSRRAKQATEKLLHAPLHTIGLAKDGTYIARLDEGCRSVTISDADAVVQLEKAIAILENDKATEEERREALCVAAELTVAIHNPANILIEKHLEKNFTFNVDNGLPKGSRFHKVTKMNWRKMWSTHIHAGFRSFSAEMFLYDWHIATKGMAKQYRKESVTPRTWAEHTGMRVLPLLDTFNADATVVNAEITKLEEPFNQCMYEAAFHLANLLNKTIK